MNEPHRLRRAAALADLFPELDASAPSRLAAGPLRASPRGRTRPPVLSAWPAGDAVGSPSDVLAGRGWEEPALLARAAAGRQALAAARVGGRWWGGAARLPTGNRYAVVAADKPMLGATPIPGDDALGRMLDRALTENRAERLVIAVPPAAGKRLRSRLEDLARAGAMLIEGEGDPWALIARAERVYSIGGETGFLALAAGVPVTACAASFYSGWGVTDDAPGLPQRPFRRTVDQIFAGACLVAARYRDPFRGAAATFEDTLDLLAEWRRIDEANRGIAVCVGMSFWKRRRVAEFVRSSAGAPVFRRTVAGALAAARRPRHVSGTTAPPAAIAGWASRLPEGLADAAARHGVPLIRVEDGFIRSVGLGSDFLPPASLVFDRTGMYYDPRGASDLERLLRETEFPPPLLARAERLAARLVARGITKYNLAAPEAGPHLAGGRTRILVPGQVEDDLSIRFGAGTVRTNLALLAHVRAKNPDALIVYKPHPDVLAGHRVGAVADEEAKRFADLIVTGGSVAALLAKVDELHTMTSLAGFEALLRGRRVVVYGRPFYAGWGLTDDKPPFERGRRLSLAGLVAGALILYPRYLDPLTGLPCGPEIVIERLDRPELWRPGPLVLARRLHGIIARRLREMRPLAPASDTSAAQRLRERPRP